MKPINFETSNMKVITNKYLLISLLVLTTLFYSSVSFAAANLEDTMAWVSKKVSNDFCKKPSQVLINGSVWYRSDNSAQIRVIDMKNRVMMERVDVVASLSKFQSQYKSHEEGVFERKFWHRMKNDDYHSNYYSKHPVTAKKSAESYAITFSLEDIVQVSVVPYKNKLSYAEKSIENSSFNVVGCWSVLIKTKEGAVKVVHLNQDIDDSFYYKTKLNFNDESMAKRVKKALEHAVKLAKEDELF
jgi:hypothetical protein